MGIFELLPQPFALPVPTAVPREVGPDVSAEVLFPSLERVTGSTSIGQDDVFGPFFVAATQVSAGSGFLAPNREQSQEGQRDGAG